MSDPTKLKPMPATHIVRIHRQVFLFAVGVMTIPAGAQTEALSPVFVTATRSGETAAAVPFSHVSLEGIDLRESPNTTVDGMLRSIPGFSLFRRSDSLVANPSTQGVSLRGLGPSGASRSLVLLDGVPLNDPFGGWVLWSSVPRESLGRIELVPGGGGTAWGDAALGGVIQLFTEPAIGERERLAVRTGSFNTTDVEGQVTEPVGTGTLQLLGRYTTTDGYFVVAPENRGPIDTPASSRAKWATARWRQPVGKAATLTLTIRDFEEDRGNGTPYTRNGTREKFASVALAAQPSATFQWNATAYAEGEGFSSTFSSVNAARTAETPASNQFDVPSTAVGLAWVGELAASAQARTSFGADVRDVRGETREDSAYVNGGYTKRRFAGGRQTTAGAFAEHTRNVGGGATVTAGLRADEWTDTDGHRRDYASGVLASATTYARHDGTELSPSAGIVWPAGGGVQLHASAQQAYRRPTLNELYRPYRVGNVITDSNADLKTETVTSGEVGADATRGPVEVGLAAFDTELKNTVTNVTIASGPANIPGIGAVPAGGSAQRKMNLDRVRVQGVALHVKWQIVRSLALETQYLLDDTAVRSAGVAPQLVGKQLAQVPRQSASAGLAWKTGRWRIEPRARWVDTQFDDDLNTLRLAPATVIDLSAGVTLRSGLEAFANAENLFDHRIETGRGSGIVSTGMPRMLMIGMRWWR